ncbi:hypothetical protein DFH05DRAFT_1462075 [Lentinula detonsa]|uniref:Uncharacterized protein n=1 Tax=Lentinula detonsa TaxID=2804962 RepID=A0A9W8NW33_9AGAR|nr:hypothetical protein DFH05DRAFT_1462075 [Lentinula detonsa]
MAPPIVGNSKSSSMNKSQTTSIPTFSPRVALRPRIVPLYATTIPRHLRLSPGIHRTLVSKPVYMPYPASIPDGIDLPSSVLGSSSTSPPGSPLTPLDQDFGSSAPLEVHTNLIVPPTSRLTVPNAGWDPQVLVTYRKLARDAVDIELDYKIGLSTQDIDALNRARTRIENAIPEFKEHANHWGADLLLREQLKSKKDTIVKAKKRKGKDDN